jgi:hypothetical protein
MAFDFPASPSEGQQFTPSGGPTYVYEAPRWKAQGVPVMTVSDTPPANPVVGQFWWESDSGQLFVWYNDGTSSQWVGVAGTGALTRIAKVVTSGSATTISFTAIPQLFTNLRIEFQGRDSINGLEQLARCQFNGDATSGNYTNTQYVQGVTSTAAAATIAPTADGCVFAGIPGVSGLANAVGQASIIIPNYNGTAFWKTAISQYIDVYNTTPLLDSAQAGFAWKSTAPITSIVLKAGGTAWVDGTTATLYGMG